MPHYIATLAGSPSENSRSRALIEFSSTLLAGHGVDTRGVDPKRLPAEDLLLARTGRHEISAALRDVAGAAAVIVATPVYKASFSGLLKLFLDVLPHDGLHGKAVLPLATGGSRAHLLALDYALRPVLAALGAYPILPSVFAVDEQVKVFHNAPAELDAALAARIEGAIERLVLAISAPSAVHVSRPALARCSTSLAPAKFVTPA